MRWKKRIALFGGSFNPPHLGHVEMCRWLLDRGDLDAVWVIPCFLHPFEKPLVSFEDRYAMCLFAFSPLGRRVLVIDVERELGGLSHTVRTIKYLAQKYPRYVFQLVTGSDAAAETPAWKDAEEIQKLVSMITVPRGTPSPIPDISSHQVRECVHARQPFAHLIPKSVAVYIVTHELYR